MRVDGFFVVGRETPDGDALFMQTYTLLDGALLNRRWGPLGRADRYLMFEDAKKAAENTSLQCGSDKPAAVWRVEVTATKEDDGK